MSIESELSKRLNRVKSVFDIERLLNEPVSDELTVDYYTLSRPAYKLLHSQDAIHFALNFDGRFHRQGYYGQADLVQKHIDAYRPKRILELGCGRGFNSVYLAKRNPSLSFTGIDLTPVHISEAYKNARRCSNLNLMRGTFLELPFADGWFDLVFEVEAVCHAADLERMFREAHRVLKPGGHFIIFDGARLAGFSRLTGEMQTAGRLVERGMAIAANSDAREVAQMIERVGFQVVADTNLSAAVMPTLKRLQRWAELYFAVPALSRLLLKVVSPIVLQNAISCLLIPLTVEAGIHYYYQQILRRPAVN